MSCLLYITVVLLCHRLTQAFTKYGCTNGLDLYVNDPDYDISCQKEPLFNITFGPNVQVITPVEAIYVAGVTFSDSVITIEDNAFYYRAFIKFINFGRNVQTIGSYAFYYASHLTAINIPDSVISIGDFAFTRSVSVVNITLGNSLQTIGYNAFGGSGHRGTIDLVLPASLRSLSELAFNYAGLRSLTINEGLTYIPEDAFSRSSVEVVTISNTVEYIGPYAFDTCFHLTTINWGNSVSVIDAHAFENIASSMTSLVLPDSITFIGDYAFAYCSYICSLQNVTFGANVESIGAFAFAYNDLGYEIFTPSVLTTIIFTGNALHTIGDYAFTLTSLTSVTLPEGLLYLDNSSFKGCADLEYILLPESLEYVGPEVFENCTSLTSINIPNAVTTIEDGAFSGCDSLSCVYWDSNVIREMGEDVFRNCPLTGCGPSEVPTFTPTFRPSVSSKPTVSFMPTRLPSYAKTSVPSSKPSTQQPTKLGRNPKFSFTIAQKIKGIDASTFLSADDNDRIFLAAVYLTANDESIVDFNVLDVSNAFVSRLRLLISIGGNVNATRDAINIQYDVIFGASSFEEAQVKYLFLSAVIINSTYDGTMTDKLQSLIALNEYDISSQMEDVDCVNGVIYSSVTFIPSDDDDDFVVGAAKTNQTTIIIAVVAGVGGFIVVAAVIMSVYWYQRYGDRKVVPKNETKQKYEVNSQELGTKPKVEGEVEVESSNNAV